MVTFNNLSLLITLLFKISILIKVDFEDLHIDNFNFIKKIVE